VTKQSEQLQRKIFRGHNYSKQNLEGADFSNADLRGANFYQAVLNGANFSNSDIRGCNFTGAQLINVNFESAKTGYTLKKKVLLRLSLIIILLSLLLYISPLIYSIYLEAVKAVNSGQLTSSVFELFLAVIAVLAAVIYGISQILNSGKGVGGTFFNYADLSGANFSEATLHNVSFNYAVLLWVDWHNADIKNSDLKLTKEIELQRTRERRGKAYQYLDLSRSCLSGVDLSGANFLYTDLSESLLNNSLLIHTNLSGVRALGTDFSGANLTGACIEGWGINSYTNFENVICDYIYLNQDKKERKPASGSFNPGDFEKLVRKFTKTLDFLLSNHTDPQAFELSLRHMLDRYGEAGVVGNSIENLGNGEVLFKFDVINPTLNKTEIHAETLQYYDSLVKQLEAERSSNASLRQDIAHIEGQLVVYREQSSFFQSFFASNRSNTMNINVTGDFNISPTNSVVSLGEISGEVTNAINQIPECAECADINHMGLRNMLVCLKATIENEKALTEDDKIIALEQLKTIAEATHNPKDGAMKRAARTAHMTLKGIANNLPHATKIATELSKLMPVLAQLFI
jgi:uncharacterized protein YjbI with pentapeptide repeats